MQTLTKKETNEMKIGRKPSKFYLRRIEKFEEIKLISRGLKANSNLDYIIAYLVRNKWELTNMKYSDIKIMIKPKEVKLDIKVEQQPTPQLLSEKEILVISKEALLRKVK